MTNPDFIHQIEDLRSDLFVKLIPHVLNPIFQTPDRIKIDMNTIIPPLLPYLSICIVVTMCIKILEDKRGRTNIFVPAFSHEIN